MPIRKNENGVLVETPIDDADLFYKTGVIRDDSFAISDEDDKTKQLKFNVSPLSPNVDFTLTAPAASSPVQVTLPEESGTLVTEETLGDILGASNPTFAIVQVPSGTNPVADSANDILTLQSDGSIDIIGNSAADSVEFRFNNSAGYITEAEAIAILENELAQATRVDFVSDTVLYRGEADPGTATSSAFWRIRRITLNSEGDAITEWADGNANYDNVWDNRASLSYS